MHDFKVPVAGGVTIVAEGSNLNAAVAPNMRLNFSATKMAHAENCTYNSAGTQLECVLPPFASGGLRVRTELSTLKKIDFCREHIDAEIKRSQTPPIRLK